MARGGRSKHGGRRKSDAAKRHLPVQVFLASLPDWDDTAASTCEPSHVDTAQLFTTFPEVMIVPAIVKEGRLRDSMYPMKLQFDGSPMYPVKLNQWRLPLVPIENCVSGGSNHTSLTMEFPSMAMAAGGRLEAKSGSTKASSQGINIPSSNCWTRCVHGFGESDQQQVDFEDDPRYIDVPPWTEFVDALNGSDIEHVTGGQPQKIALTNSSVYVEAASGSGDEQTTTNASWGRTTVSRLASLPISFSGSDTEDDAAKAPPHPSQRSALPQSKASSKSDVQDETAKVPSHTSQRSAQPHSKAFSKDCPSQRSTLPQSKAFSRNRIVASSGSELEDETAKVPSHPSQRSAQPNSKAFSKDGLSQRSALPQSKAFSKNRIVASSGSDVEDETAKAPSHPSQRSAQPHSKAFSKKRIVASSGSGVEEETAKATSHPSQRSAQPHSKAFLKYFPSQRNALAQSKGFSRYRIVSSSGSEAEMESTEGSAFLRRVAVWSGSDTHAVAEECSQTNAPASNSCRASHTVIAGGSDIKHTTTKSLSRSVACSARTSCDGPWSEKVSLKSTITNDVRSLSSCAMPSSTDEMLSALLSKRQTFLSVGMEPEVAPIGFASRDEHNNCPIHVFVVQASFGGFSNWPLGNVHTSAKWDVLLDVLLQCLVIDGAWASYTTASAFVGSDSIHLDHRIQNLADANPFSSLRRQKQCTIQERTALLWKNYLVDKPDHGLRWRRCFQRPMNPKRTRKLLIKNVRSQLNEDSASAVVLIMDFWGDITYKELKEKGEGKEPFRKTPVYIVLPGRYGFDGCRDTTDAVVQQLILCFEQHFGPRCTTRVNISTSCSSHRRCAPEVGAFISAEISAGSLQHVIAGAVALQH